MKLFLISLGLMTSLASMAGTNIEISKALKESSVEKFLKEANDPKSTLGLRIAAINEETTDGRNSEGTIKLPITEGDLQVVALGSEFMTNPWHYASKNDSGDECSASGDSAEFLILLSSYTGVHMALEFSTYAFKSSVLEFLSAKRKDGQQIEYCEDIAYDETDSYVHAPIRIDAEPIVELELNPINK